MDKSEPALVPEWLRSAGSVAGGGSSAHHFAAPSNHTDACVSHHTRNRSSKTTSDFDSPRSVFLERTFSSNSRRSINGSAKHAYSSFNRSHRDKDPEVPTIIGSSSTGSLTLQQTVAPTSGSVLTTTPSSGLNMAEALAQNPSRARSTPQVSVKTQRLEELAIKQSRQLIPVTPSMPKALVNNSSEKSKPKTAVRNTEINMAGKSMPQQASALHIVNHSVRLGNAKGDAPKTSGKFTDLKSVVWENGVSPTPKDPSCQTNYSNNRPGNHLAVASAATSTPLRNPNNLKSPTERKPASLDLKLGSTMDKKHTISQVQSRNDFFNLIKKKTLMNSSSVPDSSPVVSSPTMDKSGEVSTEAVGSPASSRGLGNGAEVTSNGNAHVEINRPENEEKDTIPDEEEAAFLRSLGWEENSGEDEGLTEEEINAFYQECMKLGTTTLKLCQGMQPKLSKFFESYATNLHGASAELSSSDSRSEA
uniref:Mediator of RNA polymerase II transcription subunit 1 n=1 Tax=Cajanus cajan TaxID=3821 RepID=A0A151RDH2_CAJCA|nr:hypothetical protein KK1_038151 [Cajanus cajan]